MSNGQAALVPSKTISKPYGWVFFYQSTTYVRTGDPMEMLLGNQPFLVDRFSGAVTEKDKTESLQQFLRRYEKNLPPKHLTAPLDLPPVEARE